MPAPHDMHQQPGGSPVTEDPIKYTYHSPKKPTTTTFRTETNLPEMSPAARLRHAAQHGDAAQLSKLLYRTDKEDQKACSLLEEADPDGFTPLHLACVSGDLECVRLLVKAGCQLSTPTPEGFTALHFAAWSGHLHVVEYVVENGASVWTTDVDGNDAVVMAQTNGHQQVVNYLRSLTQSSSTSPSKKSETSAAHIANLSLASHERISSDTSEVASVQKTQHAKASPLSNTKSGDGMTALHIAILHDQLETVKMLTSRGADLHVSAPDGSSALHLAAERGNDMILTHLISLRAFDVNTINVDGYTPLHLAAHGGHEACLRLLLEAGASVDQSTRSGTTALHKAAETGHVLCAELLLDFGANINAVTTEYAPKRMLQKVASLAPSSPRSEVSNSSDEAAHAHASVYAEFLDDSAEGKWSAHSPTSTEGEKKAERELHQSQSKSQVALSLAAQNGHLDMVKYLCERGDAQLPSIDDETSEYSHPLILAAQNNHLDTVRYLLDFPSLHLENAASKVLCVAAENGFLKLVELAVSKNAELEFIGGQKRATALVLAARGGHLSVVLHLLWCGSDIEGKTKASGYTALHQAARHGHASVVNTLMLEGANMNAQGNSRRSTALHLAVEGGHEEVVRTLLANGADTTLTRKSGVTALHIACERGRARIAQALLEKSPSLLEADAANGIKPLYLACCCGEMQTIKYLLCQRASIDVQCGDHKSTPLRAAASRGLVKVAELLIVNGADVNACQKDGSTCLHSAAARGDEGMITMLLARGAHPDQVNGKGKTPMHYAQNDDIKLQLKKAVLKYHWQQEAQGKDKRSAATKLNF